MDTNKNVEISKSNNDLQASVDNVYFIQPLCYSMEMYHKNYSEPHFKQLVRKFPIQDITII